MIAVTVAAGVVEKAGVVVELTVAWVVGVEVADSTTVGLPAGVVAEVGVEVAEEPPVGMEVGLEDADISVDVGEVTAVAVGMPGPAGTTMGFVQAGRKAKRHKASGKNIFIPPIPVFELKSDIFIKNLHKISME